MTPRLVAASLIVAGPLLAAEPAPDTAVAMPWTLSPKVAHASSVGEWPDGRVLVSDAVTPAVWVVDPKSGAVTPWGSAGAGANQWVTPGGIYTGPNGTLLLLDRAQVRVSVIGADGAVVRTYSVAQRGRTMSSSSDIDLQRLDAGGHAYFSDATAAMLRARGQAPRTIPLMRLDPASQQASELATLAEPESQSSSTGPGLTLIRTVMGSPADGWGVAPDGRVAVVHAEPYRVDWISAAGAVSHGPEIMHDIVPMTDADKTAARAKAARQPSLVGASHSGDTTQTSAPDLLFATTKAAFEPDGVIVSPDAQVWVRRSTPAGATTVTYDVFDGTGARVHRVAFPDGITVVGFGKNVVYTRRVDAAGHETIGRYRR